MTLGSDATGDVYFRDASGFLEKLAASTDGHVLTSTGAGSIPAWEAIPSSGLDAANGVDNRIATFTDSDSLNGEANLTFDGSTLTVTGDQVLSGAAELFVNDTANANVTTGITINQGAADDEILTLKSSDVAQGQTTYAEADTFGTFSKVSATAGGLEIMGLRDADGDPHGALNLVARISETGATTTDDAAALAVMGFQSWVREAGGDGTTHNRVQDTENAFAWYSGGNTVMVLKGGGVLHLTNTTLVALDDEDRAMQQQSSDGLGMAMTKWDEEMSASVDDLRRVGALSSYNPKTGQSDFRNVQRYQDVLGGAIWQTHARLMDTKEEMQKIIGVQSNRIAILETQVQGLLN
jgi:hypothetical protein